VIAPSIRYPVACLVDAVREGRTRTQPAFRSNCLPKSKLFRFWKEGKV
jgi:hypothetical protein